MGKIPWRRKGQLTPVFWPGKSHGQRSLVGYNPWDRKRVRHALATIQLSYIYILISEAIFLVIFLHYVKGLEILYLIVCRGNWEELAIFLHFRVKNKKEKMFRKKGETGSDECLLYAAVPSCKMECVVVQEALKKQHTPITQELKQWASRLSGKQITSRCTLSSSSAENTEYMCRNRPHLFLLCVALTFC